ncbi:hypothetical protein MBLNU230_g2833t1 [Neophaeotheca triangularis]
MAPACEICYTNDSKYKCPKCGLRYCSLLCYKPHKASHEEEVQTSAPALQLSESTPNSTGSQRQPKKDFSGFENDPDFLRLLTRYPMLKYQLQATYAMTVEPGPDDARTWTRHPYNLPPGPTNRGRGRGRGNFGRGHGHGQSDEDRQYGAWSREKGDKEALSIIKKARSEDDESEMAEGMREFVMLCRMRFGDKQSSST